ncbi:hypothetical protein [Stenoxybacter acetivorans]|uniref:hypothetical protein n=1 Tax=Stenoxybacter acetivorans TaxID=422441 RepID=UPI0005691018|nr:hypothetical protein [Stenoxybacter acetivorans]
MTKSNLNKFFAENLTNTEIVDIEEYVVDFPENFHYSSGLWAVWDYMDYLGKEKQKFVFLYALYYLLKTKLIRLGCNNRLLDISPEEAVQSFIDRWPPDEWISKTMVICYVIDRYEDSEEEWHLRYWTIGDLVWVYPDGELSWSMDAANMDDPEPIEELPWIKSAQQS